jgi:hypothetical protein
MAVDNSMKSTLIQNLFPDLKLSYAVLPHMADMTITDIVETSNTVVQTMSIPTLFDGDVRKEVFSSDHIESTPSTFGSSTYIRSPEIRPAARHDREFHKLTMTMIMVVERCHPRSRGVWGFLREN